MIREIFIDLLIGAGIGGGIALIPFVCMSMGEVGFTVLYSLSWPEISNSVWAFALCCGVLVLGMLLICLKSRTTIILPAIIILSLALYYFVDIPFMHIIVHGVLWICSIIVISLGIVPALVLSKLVENPSSTMAVICSCIFGYIVGIIVRRITYLDMPWDGLWFEKKYSFPLRKLRWKLSDCLESGMKFMKNQSAMHIPCSGIVKTKQSNGFTVDDSKSLMRWSIFMNNRCEICGRHFYSVPNRYCAEHSNKMDKEKHSEENILKDIAGKVYGFVPDSEQQEYKAFEKIYSIRYHSRYLFELDRMARSGKTLPFYGESEMSIGELDVDNPTEKDDKFLKEWVQLENLDFSHEYDLEPSYLRNRISKKEYAIGRKVLCNHRGANDKPKNVFQERLKPSWYYRDYSSSSSYDWHASSDIISDSMDDGEIDGFESHHAVAYHSGGGFSDSYRYGNHTVTYHSDGETSDSYRYGDHTVTYHSGGGSSDSYQYGDHTVTYNSDGTTSDTYKYGDNHYVTYHSDGTVTDHYE